MRISGDPSERHFPIPFFLSKFIIQNVCYFRGNARTVKSIAVCYCGGNETWAWLHPVRTVPFRLFLLSADDNRKPDEQLFSLSCVKTYKERQWQSLPTGLSAGPRVLIGSPTLSMKADCDSCCMQLLVTLP
jgi:hypothetical protein